LKPVRPASGLRSQHTLYTDVFRFFAFLPCAARPIDRQYATSDYMLQRNMIKYRDVACPKNVIVLKRGAA
jgi:hypothetical protein